ncbi:MAG: ABC transporter substrate-binding protein [Acidimicrobiales bacterium]
MTIVGELATRRSGALHCWSTIPAREAIVYATDVEPINRALFAHTSSLTDTPTGPGDPYYFPKIGYPINALKKANVLVKQLGGSNIKLLCQNVLQVEETDDALQSEWGKAGIQTTIEAQDQPTYVQDAKAGKWEAEISDPGTWDPAIGFGLPFDFGSKGILSGIRDQNWVQAASGPLTESIGHGDYAKNIFTYMNANQYCVMVFVGTLFTLTAKDVTFSTNNLGLFAPPLQSYYETLAYTSSTRADLSKQRLRGGQTHGSSWQSVVRLQ